MVRYAVLNDHSQNVVYSPDLSETLLSGRVSSCTKDFLGRKKELSEVATALKNNPLLFITGIAELEFTSDTAQMTETELFESHYGILKSLYPDSLIIIDNFNVLPKDDTFFREFIIFSLYTMEKAETGTV